MASILAPIGAGMVFFTGLDRMDGCYDPAVEQPLFEGMKTCNELYDLGAMEFLGAGCALLLGSATAAIVIAFRANRHGKVS